MLLLKCIVNKQFDDKISEVAIIPSITIYSIDSGREDGEAETCNIIASEPFRNVIKMRSSLRVPGVYYHVVANGSPHPGIPLLLMSKFDGNSIKCVIDMIFIGCNAELASRAVHPSPLPKDIGRMMSFDEKNQFSDVTLVAMSKADGDVETPVEFFAHKVILAARSPVFAKMFSHEMQESLTNKVTLLDVDAAVLREMLFYVYTGRVIQMADLAKDLLFVADKYDLKHLKSLCEEHLSRTLQVGNASSVLQIANLYNAANLKKDTLLYIAQHVDEVRATKEWEEVKQNGELLDELIEVITEPAAKRPRIGEE